MSNPDDPQVLRVGPALLTYECEKCKSKIQPKEENLYERDVMVDLDAPINSRNFIRSRGNTVVWCYRNSMHVCPVCQKENFVKKVEICVPHEPVNTSGNYCILV